MTFTSDTEIEHIGEGLIACTLPKSEWTHAAHFAAAIWLLGHAANDPLTEMPELIRRYNLSVGTPNTDTDGYHETITIASLLAAKYILSTRKCQRRSKNLPDGGVKVGHCGGQHKAVAGGVKVVQSVG